jgi:hypothetical protein
MIEDKIDLDFKKPIIIGTEIVSFSALMSCFHHKLKVQAMIEPSNKLNTFFPLKLFPIITNIPIYYNSEIIEINGIDNVKSVTIKTNNNIKTIKCDALIFTGNFVSEHTLMLASDLESYIKNDKIKVDKIGKITTNIWISGNILHPGLSGDLCYNEGKALARNILKRFEEDY